PQSQRHLHFTMSFSELKKPMTTSFPNLFPERSSLLEGLPHPQLVETGRPFFRLASNVLLRRRTSLPQSQRQRHSALRLPLPKSLVPASSIATNFPNRMPVMSFKAVIS